MKKSIQVCIIVILSLALVFAVFTAVNPGTDLAKGKACPHVGWNGRGSDQCSSVATQIPVIQELAFSTDLPEFAPLPIWPDFSPSCVGWNG